METAADQPGAERETAESPAGAAPELLLAPSQRFLRDTQEEEIRTGRHALRVLWAALAPPERALCDLLASGITLLSNPHNTLRYDAHGPLGVRRRAARFTTVGVLVGCHLLRWSGPPDDPFRSADLTDRGHALLTLRRNIH